MLVNTQKPIEFEKGLDGRHSAFSRVTISTRPALVGVVADGDSYEEALTYHIERRADSVCGITEMKKSIESIGG